MDYIRIDIAGQYGLSKKSFEDRIQWVHANESSLEGLVCTADDKYLYTRAVNAYRDSQQGIATGYTIGLDATASGASIMSVISGCPIGAKYTNLTDGSTKYNIYTQVVVEMNKILPMDKQITLNKGVDGLTGGDCKEAMMCTLYGSKAMPKKIFGEGTEELSAFYQALYKVAPGAMSVLADLLSCWNPEALEHTWNTPDGATSKVLVTATIDKSINVDGFGKFTYRAEINKPSTHGLSIVANTIHSLDAYLISECTRRCAADGFEMYSIHDSLWCSPIHANKLRQHYQDVLIELAEGNVMQDICSQLLGKKIVYNKDTNDLAKHLKKGEYFIS